MIKRVISFFLLLAATSAAYAAMPALNVVVSDASGHVAFKGRTSPSGGFATAKLQPGDYVVQFNSNSAPQGSYMLFVSAGRQKVSSEGVAGTKFVQGGVAMRIKVAKDTSVTGQVSTVSASETNNPKIKIVNGKRMIWVTGGTGSNLGGHWIEEGSADARNVQGLSNSAVSRIQERGASGLGGN